jgi:hypothetical protein
MRKQSRISHLRRRRELASVLKSNNFTFSLEARSAVKGTGISGLAGCG